MWKPKMRQSQVAREENAPRLLQSVVAAMKIPDLRNRLLFVFAMLAIFRFLAQVPVPGVEREALANFFRDNDLFGFLDVFSGGALRSLSVVALGVFPYITASIIMQLMVPVFPQLREISKEGEIHIQHASGNTFAYRINADGSITSIAFIYRGDRSKEPSQTYKKIK